VIASLPVIVRQVLVRPNILREEPNSWILGEGRDTSKDRGCFTWYCRNSF
jgi:hypothetical protein